MSIRSQYGCFDIACVCLFVNLFAGGFKKSQEAEKEKGSLPLSPQSSSPTAAAAVEEEE